MSKPRVKLIPLHQQWRARNHKVSEEVTNIILEHLAIGLPVNHCCALAEIHENTYYDWMKKGEEYYASPNPKEEHHQYAVFRSKVLSVIAQWQASKIRASFQSDKYSPNWTRDMTILERRDRSNWGRNDQLTVRDGGIDPDAKYL